ncbi:disease resistance protein L6-like [Rhodamnia argentea]|uniref:Disease resistance protein L6-like n=1 Tax=Rhodamnia argentea TaxID=178133 RepID=A0A8B8NNG9_9MYRT|nr:disease resistance protein L6-like [Rhodamnia argentea]
MKGAGIRVFLDSEELRYGKSIKEVLKAVDESQIYVPIFSKKFASRSWCLRELARMVECHSESKGKREIIPIFCDVKTQDVKLNTDLYEKDILEHSKDFEARELDRWRSALKKVGGIIGPKLEGKGEGKEIESIVKEVLCMLGKHVDVPGELVEDYRQIKAIIEKLDLNYGGVRFLGIHGLGGIGKTTLAKVVFKKLVSHFDRVSFLNDIRESSQHGLDGLVALQKKLLTSVGSSSLADHIQDTGGGMYWIKAFCQNKRVLIVLDDLDKKEQLEKLAGKSDWFGSGSRIIITTRDEGILMTQVESSSEDGQNQPEGILRYPVCEMEFDHALQLFYNHALRSNSPTKDYDALSKDIIRKVAMLPLAIEVIGSYLYGLGFALEPHDDKIKLLDETLRKLDEGPFEGVRKVLMISYKGLEAKQREVFLDIACFFTNEDQTYPLIMWYDCKYYPDSAVRVLRLRSLIKIRENKLWMHDQVLDLGRYIVLEEYPCKENRFKFSRVWTHEDAEELLQRKERNEHVQALSLTSGGSSHNFAAEELVALPKLRFLQAKGLDISGDFENLLSMLRWLSWQTCRTTFQAKNFHFSRLIVLNLSDSNIEDGWAGWSQMKMDKLKVLDLTGCMRLTRTPDLSNFTSLETLILAWCVNLTTIDRSIGKLKLLETFNINRCRALHGLPLEFGSLQSLTEIIMPQNYQPFTLPETFGNLHSLSSLILDEHPGIRQLPDYWKVGESPTFIFMRVCGHKEASKLYWRNGNVG